MGKAHPFLAPLTCFPSQTQSARSVDRKYLALLFPIPSALISPPRSPIWHVSFIVEAPLSPLNDYSAVSPCPASAHFIPSPMFTARTGFLHENDGPICCVSDSAVKEE